MTNAAPGTRMDPITDNSLVRMRELFPPAMSLPGVDMEICDVDHGTGTTTLRFDVSDARTNQFGSVQGGVVATLLDACIGFAGAVRSGGVLAMPLADSPGAMSFRTEGWSEASSRQRVRVGR